MAEFIEREAACSLMPDDYYGWRDKQILKSVPAADVQPVRHGRWYRFHKVYADPQSGYGFGRDMYKCDVCNVGEQETRKPYCPECGAKMDKEDTDAEKSD